MTLQEQMREKAETDRMEQDMKSLESHIVIQRDREELEEEKQKQKHRSRSLIRVTTRNKEVKSLCFHFFMHDSFLFTIVNGK